MKKEQARIGIAYVPVLHRGYLNWIEATHLTHLWVLSSELSLDLEPSLRKDIRALTPDHIVASLQAVQPKIQAQVVSDKNLPDLIAAHPDATWHIPDELVSRQLVEKYLPTKPVEWGSVFLRWDASNSTKPKDVQPTESVEATVLQKRWFNNAQWIAEQSADWWRQVGGVIIKDDVPILSAFNKHVPHEQQPYLDGDPRGSFHKGEHIEVSTAMHCETAMIAQAAARGLNLTGAELYITTFPCPYCAKLVAYSGIKTVYYTEGYAMADGESILKDRGVEIVRVKMEK
jgi:dCMP deaminase